MPLSAVCVSTVGGRHKPWSSRTNSPTKDARDLMTMNNSEEILTYRGSSQNIYTPLKKPAYFEYDISDDKPTKKEKKWSFGNLFRRKKKTNDSSSDDEVKDKSKKKSEKRKKPITFDHIVITPAQVKSPDAQSYSATDKTENPLVVSRQVIPNQSKSLPSKSISTDQSGGQYEQIKVTSRTSLDNLGRKSRKDLTKVRAEARRTSLNRNSSSDEDSQRSNSSQKFISDESLYRTRDSSCHRKSRAARTERYLKRHSKDGENPNNYLRISKSDAESTFLRVSDESTRSPSASPQLLKSSFSSLSSQPPSVIGLSTIPPSHIHHGRFRVSNSTSNPSYKPPLSMNDYNNTAKAYTSQKGNKILPNQRSISFDADIHRPYEQPEVIYAKLELGKPITRNLTLVDNNQLRRYYNVYQPPAPPPRDPKRLHGSLILDTLNHNNNFSDTSSVNARYNLSNDVSNSQVRRLNSINRPAFKSSSENHIPRENSIILSQRPSSTTPETTIRRNVTTDGRSRADNYQYLTDKQPRSRKPIFIQNEMKNKSIPKEKIEDNHLQFSARDTGSFLEQLQAKKSNRCSRGSSPQIFTCETKLQTEIFLPSVLPNNNRDNEIIQPTLNEKDDNEKPKDLDTMNQNTVNIDEEESTKKKSANLEEALNELEAIYNSLKLGDEDLLEMAEKREKEVATQKMLESRSQYPMYTRGAFSDSSFSYEPFDSLDSRRRKRYSRKSLRSDDMAFRKLNKQERSATITDPQAVASKVSYLLSSPIYSSDQRIENCCDPNEPDTTLDDVVYRNIKQYNKLKVPEHPPPFGIPLGPIALAANSDYLHAVPDTESVKPSKMPDLVKDDLAYRNLRKDNTKEPALPPVSSDDLKNNNMSHSIHSPTNAPKVDFAELKKNRAVRSKSANIGSLMSQEVIERASRRNARDKNNEYKTLTDIADAMQIAHQVLREKEKRLNENKAASFSDTDSVYSKYSRFRPSHKKPGDENDNHTIVCNSPNIEDAIDAEANKVFDEIFLSLSNKKEPTQNSRRSVKESTPDPISSFEDAKLAPLLQTNSFEDVLTALAIEAKEASDKFTQDLKELDVNKPTERETMVANDSPSSCRKLLEAAAVIQSPKKLEKKKDEEDIVMESVATIVFSKSYKDGSTESDHDYENVGSETEMKTEVLDDVDRTASLPDGKIQNDIQRKDIKANIPEYCDLSTEVPNRESQDTTGETCVDVVMSNASQCISVNELPLNSVDSCLPDSGSSLAVHSNASSSDYVGSFSIEKSVSKIELSQSLKSPKLVLETSKFNDRRKQNSEPSPGLSCNSIQPSTSRNFLDLKRIPDNSFKSACILENNPASLAIACSYGVACLYQLAASDLFTVLGIILAIFTFIASLFF